MRVLLVQGYLGHKNLAVFPLGLCLIATILKDHETRIYDPNEAGDAYGDLEKTLLDFKPQVVGLSLRNADNQELFNYSSYLKTMRPTIAAIKKAAPSAKIVIGGAGFSMFARPIMEKFAELDFGVFLEGEETFPELLANLDAPDKVAGVFYRQNGNVLFTGARPNPDFANLPFPNKDFVDISKYSYYREGVGIQTKRGCHLDCCYCTYPFLNGNRIRLRKPEHIVDEIEDLVRRGVTGFMFADAIFTIPIKHATQVCEEIIRRKLKVEWSAWGEPKSVSREFLLLAREAGMRNISYSPDSFSAPALKEMGKRISRDDIIKVYRLATEIEGIKTGFGFFISPPRETVFGFFETLYFFFKANLILWRNGRGGVGLNWIRIEPDTRVHKIAIDEGLVDKGDALLPPIDEDFDLNKLFYVNPRLKKVDWVARLFITLAEQVRKMKRAVFGGGTMRN